MMRCFGMLGSGQSEEAVRVGLSVGEGVLRATEAGGANWDIPLTRVHLIAWGADELRLELAGTEVSFIPDDPDTALVELVPALLAGQRRGAAVTDAAIVSTGMATSPPDAPELIVDLTTTTPEHSPSTPVVVAPPVRRWPRRLGWVLLVAALGAGTVAITQLGSSSDPTGAVREAVAAGGFPPISVSVDDGVATLTGSVTSREVAEAVAATVAGVDGINSVTNRLEAAEPDQPTEPTLPATSGSEASTAAAETALADAGIDTASVRVDDGIAVLSGTIASEFNRIAAGAMLLALDGIEQIDNQLVVAPQPDDAIRAAAQAALAAGGFETVAVSVDAGVATVAGVVPRDVLSSGFFHYSDQVEDAVLRVQGVVAVRDRLQLVGDEATLRRQLRELTDTSPVVFALGRSELTATAVSTLEAAAGIIQAQPGLRVLIAGHTDTSGSPEFNEELSRERAEAVRGRLIEQGIAANRLLVVAYGELFPSTPGVRLEDRRVEFEVAG